MNGPSAHELVEDLLCGVGSARPLEKRPPHRVRLLRVRDVAELLAVSERSVRRWRSDGLLPPALEIAGVVRWRPEAIEAWLANREGRSGASDAAHR